MDENRAPGARERLLAAGETLFADRGYAATGTREIAARAGCNLSMIKYYFGSKEGLLREILVSHAGLVGDEIRGLLSADLPPEERLRRLFGFVVDFFDRNADFMRIVFQELIVGQSPVLGDVRDTIRANQTAFVSLLEGARREGRLRDVDPPVATVMLMGMLVFYFLGYPLTSQVVGPKSPDVLEALKRHAYTIAVGGIITPPEGAIRGRREGRP
ncbi:MAG: TetR/AcrR family transcriptional regulator [Deltaproteobacteria bacterium]|nr:TetR/AcrR family transcriptional regulator [Deltaproteobacteria bacterium]